VSRFLAGAVLIGLATGSVGILRKSNPPEDSYQIALKLLRNGDFEPAADEAERAERRTNEPEWRSRFRLLRAEALLEDGKSDAAVKLLGAIGESETVESAVRRQVLLARLCIRRADLTQAYEMAAEARRIACAHGRTDLQVEADLRLGEILGRERRLDDAEASLESARNAAASIGDRFRAASATNGLGMVQMLRSHCDKAIPLFEQAERMFREAGASHPVAAARNNIGLCYSQLGDFEKAFTYRQAALELSKSSILKANALGETGTVLLATDPVRAVPYYRAARDMARQFGARSDAARWAGNLASALVAVGDLEGAEAALHEARKLGPELRSSAFLDLNAASIALGRGRLGEARTIYSSVIAASANNPAVLWQAHAGIAATEVASKRPDDAVRSFEAAIRVIEDAQSDLNRNEHKLTFLSRLMGLYQDYVDLLISRQEPVRALAVADRSRARLLSEGISHRIGGNKELSPEALHAIVRSSGKVWLAYWVAPKRSFLWAATPAGINVFTLPGQMEIAALVKEYRAFIETGMRDPLRTPSEAGRKLYDILIAPAASAIPKNSEVLVIPDGPLHEISFDTLPVYEEGNPHYFVHDAIVAITPSIGVSRGQSTTRIFRRDALIIGNPVSPGPEYPTLQHAGREIASVARHMTSARTVVVTGEAARPEVWKASNPGRFAMVHIAAHAEANEHSPLDSAIVLSPGSGYRLYARDIIGVPLRAQMVSLSACRSSGTRAYGGEGMVGFAWAFLYAGSRSVVAGLWDVADESTAIMMDGLYARLEAGDTPAVALRNARIALMGTAYSKPYYWGAFQCYTR
jgi:tetratricopeptide (TPR) repeat protein